MDGSEPSSNEPPFVLSILYPDGSVSAEVSKAAVAASLLAGEMQCAITGKGFNRCVRTCVCVWGMI